MERRACGLIKNYPKSLFAVWKDISRTLAPPPPWRVQIFGFKEKECSCGWNLMDTRKPSGSAAYCNAGQQPGVHRLQTLTLTQLAD